MDTEGPSIEQNEIDQAIKEFKDKRYSCPEGVKMAVLYEAANRFIHQEIYTIARMAFKSMHVPRVCWQTRGTIKPKNAPGQYRIVHVSNPLATLLEIIALHRLEYKLEHLAIISPYQYSFTALRGRHDLKARIIEITASSKTQDDECDNANNTNTATTVVAPYIEGAFDNVDQDVIIDKMNKELGQDLLKYWITKSILSRRISIQYGNLKSKERWV